MTNPTLQTAVYPITPRMLMALEISAKKWKLCFSNGAKNRIVTVDARDYPRLMEETAKAKLKLGFAPSAPVTCVHEAGRDGFSIHRQLVDLKFESIVTDSASIEISRKMRQAKTDKLDVERLLNLLRRYLGGELKALCPVRVPTVADEDARRPTRELERLKDERTSTTNRVKALLATVGVVFTSLRALKADVDSDARIPPQLKKELKRDVARLELVRAQVHDVENEMKTSIEETKSAANDKTIALAKLRGIAWLGASTLVAEFFGWRTFKNRRQVGAAAGMVGTPYDSGDDSREQGISKAGNKRVRKLIIQLAWGWIRHQPNSKDTLWFMERFATGKRIKKIGIVALGRRLLIALWRYVEQGVVPPGAEFKPGE